jgi:hypothetical protein
MEHKVRTAKKREFTDSCGEKVKKGEKFILVETRPQFYSRAWLEKALADLDKDGEA